MAETPLQVRKAVGHDLPALCRMWRALHDLHLPMFPEAGRTEPGDPTEFLRAAMTDQHQVVLVADREGDAVAFAHVMMHRETDPGGWLDRVLSAWLRPASPPTRLPKRAYLAGLFVQPAHRRRNLGRALSEAAEHWAIQQGACWIELDVYEGNAEAFQFYRALGYRPHARRMLRELNTPR